MKRSGWVIATVLLGLTPVLQVQAQTSAGYPFLVTATSNATGRPIDPIGANSEEEAREWVDYLESHPSPGFSNVDYARNPNVDATPSVPVLDRNRTGKTLSPSETGGYLPMPAPQPALAPKPRRTIFDQISPHIKNWHQGLPSSARSNLPPDVLPQLAIPSPSPSPTPSNPVSQQPYSSAPSQGGPSDSYGYDDNAPKGVLMILGINPTTLQKADTPARLFAKIRGGA